ncbi:MAG: methyltransferase domain-containing protein [Candidatus Odinarchaeota archaeon]
MKLNIGCGKKFEPGYCNIDLYETLIADKVMSALNLEFEDNKSDEIKAIHVIEHLTYFEAIYALSEFFRVLKPNGKGIIEIPDLSKACQLYSNSDDEFKKQILDWIFGAPHKGLQHKFCFPPFLLVEVLESIGYININTRKFINYESIPTIRFECYKPLSKENFEVFQILTHIRKKLLSENYIDFSDSFLVKEHENLLALFLVKMLEFKKRESIEIFFELIIESLIKRPQFAKILLVSIEDANYLSKTKFKQFHEIIDLLIKFNFPDILCHLLKKVPLSPGSQRLVLRSIESFARNLVRKLLYNIDEKENIKNKLHKLFNEVEHTELNFFSSKIIEQKSIDYFYVGIKAFYKENYKLAYNKFFRAVKLYRDDFLYFWNLSRVLAKLNMKEQAIKFYKKTLICLRITKIQLKKKFKSIIKKELIWVKNRKGSPPKLEPIISIENYIKFKR